MQWIEYQSVFPVKQLCIFSRNEITSYLSMMRDAIDYVKYQAFLVSVMMAAVVAIVIVLVVVVVVWNAVYQSKDRTNDMRRITHFCSFRWKFFILSGVDSLWGLKAWW